MAEHMHLTSENKPPRSRGCHLGATSLGRGPICVVFFTIECMLIPVPLFQLAITPLFRVLQDEHSFDARIKEMNVDDMIDWLEFLFMAELIHPGVLAAIADIEAWRSRVHAHRAHEA